MAQTPSSPAFPLALIAGVFTIRLAPNVDPTATVEGDRVALARLNSI